jgi:altronate dehydratase large subunit
MPLSRAARVGRDVFHVDVDVSGVIKGFGTLRRAGERLLGELVEVASGRLTKAEISNYTKFMNIYTVGLVI